MTSTSIIIEPEQAQVFIEDHSPIIVDLSQAENYLQAHIPNAINLDYSLLTHGHPPAPGNLPEPVRLQALLDALGIAKENKILIYDSEGMGKSSRFIWVLDCVGYNGYKMINGGLQSWASEDYALDSAVTLAESEEQAAITINAHPIATKEDVLEAIDAPGTVILDVRTAAEYSGQRGGSRFGHIPSSVNLNWLDTMDPNNNQKILPAQQLLSMYEKIGVTPDKQIIAHCQTHHRSSHTYVLLKHLGFTNVRGYGGSWAEWSADMSLPIV
ncbi:MAG: thiosulfate/3-mercaptopyruvate sulfurtransferase [Saprospiraceae bacterium]|jgi:thiosulfate/3-mercaptopyruvate sulfurtransferase